MRTIMAIFITKSAIQNGGVIILGEIASQHHYYGVNKYAYTAIISVKGIHNYWIIDSVAFQ